MYKRQDLDTSLYKRINTIPSIDFNGVLPSGNLKVGNYMDRSPGFGSAHTDSGTIKTWFPYGSTPSVLNLASMHNSPDRSTKSTRFLQ